MLRFAALIAAALVTASPAWAQFQRTSGPNGEATRRIAIAPDGTAYATRSVGTLLRRAPGEHFWSLVPQINLQSVIVAPQGRAWGLQSAGPVIVSDDGGTTWIPLAAAPALSDVVFDAAGQVFGRTAAGVVRSTDAGTTWTNVFASPVDALAIDPGGAVWIADQATLRRSVNAGATWNPIVVLPARVTALAAHPSDGVYAALAAPAAGTVLGLYRVFANGNLTPLDFAGQSMNALHVGPGGVVLVGMGGACDVTYCPFAGLYRSTNEGATWERASVGGSVLDIDSAGELLGIATGAFTFSEVCRSDPPGTLFSQDAGLTWGARNGGLSIPLVWALASNRHGAVAALTQIGGGIASTSDKGATWDALNTVGTGICAGATEWQSIALTGAGTVVVNTAWSDPPYSLWHRITPFPFSFVATAHDIIVAQFSTVPASYASNLSSGFSPCIGLTGFVQDFAAGPLGSVAAWTDVGIALSIDDGVHWNTISPLLGKVAIAADEQTVFVVQAPAIVRLPASANWAPQSLPLLPGQPAVQCIRADPFGGLCVAALDNTNHRHFFRLRPGASGWDEFASPPSVLFEITPDGSVYFAAVGVWRADNLFGATSTSTMAAVSDHGVQASPSPFRARTQFAFELPQASPVNLAVFDVRGRLVTELLRSGSLAAGRHTAAWEPGIAQPSGVYWYRLRTGATQASGRVVLAR